MIRATLAGLRARKLRLLLSGLAVVLGVLFVSAALVLTGTLGRSLDNLYAGLYEDTEVRVTAQQVLPGTGEDAETTPVPADLVGKVAAAGGVASATGVVSEDGARLIGAGGKTVPAAFGRPRLGTNWTGERGPERLVAGRGPQAPDEIAINGALARAGKVHLGDRVGVLTQRPKQTFTIVGIIGYTGNRDSLGGASEIAFHESVASELMLGRPAVYTAIDVRAAPGVAPAELRDRLRAALGTGVSVQLGADLRAQQAAAAKDDLSVTGQILLFVAAIALFVGAFLILNTFSITIAQRTRELALLRALGAARRQVIGAVLLEAAATGLVSSVVGVALGVGAGALLIRLANTAGAGALGLGAPAVPATAVVVPFAVGLIVTVLAAVTPALRAARIPPVAALRESATADRPLTRLTVAGAIVAAGGAALLIAGFAGGTDDIPLGTVLGGVLVAFVGAALLTPVVARPAAALIGRLFAWSVAGRLGRLNAGRNPRRTAITASALMVGIALVTGVNVVLTSATASFQRTAGDYYRADLIVSDTTSSGRPQTFDPAILDRARALPGVAAVVGEYPDLVVIDGHRGSVTAVDDPAAWASMVHVTLRSGTLGPLGPDQFVADAGSAAEQGLRVGSPVRFTFASGRQRTLTLAGTYSSDWSDGWILPGSVVPELSRPQPTMALVRLSPGASVDDARHRIGALLADSPEIVVSDRAGFVGIVTGVFGTVLALLQVLLGLALLIAALGVVNTLVLSVLERTRELGLLRAIGLDRRRTVWMVAAEAMVISIFGAALGLAVGVGLGAAIGRALHGEGVTHLALPWAFMGRYLLLGAAVGALAAVLPAVRAARTDVLRAISHE
ncbi:ABC transporter permease [Dactylosporangium sp. CA-092794]|uniref:ABC transporter permease n=1 Tax=Dactylosporangium sp. CA-092794 TaxID=3239929 RepID=UPI003D9317C0